ncbi:c-type cytochrome [Taibaiella lutea]|uniref:C-type cytochrome n=1 Tax=Taibaiella lutea TaxID=2608001 RepID=A0A5M6CED2_9BACT|nr:di-heme oxidoredictase family protein [Taibaiella lutea]KAA5533524.1 c-type cytochrome [Taibaiella lutea]
MKKISVVCILLVIVVTGTLCRKAEPFPEEQYDSRLSGGAATVFLANSQAFGSAIPGLTGYDVFTHDLGDALFGQTFVSAPAPKFGGLGPVYNNVSCVSCHHNDGKGTATIGSITSSLLTRISISGTDENGGPLSIPGYGVQLQDKATTGKSPEAKVQISYTELPFTFPDGETVSLRKPTYTLNTPYTALPANYYVSVRLAPPVFGMGLLALISDATILKNADENDANQDGISGRANYVYDPYTHQRVLGKFGLKANNPSLLVQVAGAFHQDMGITSYVFPKESSYGQAQSDGLNDDPELADSLLNATVFYVQTLAVPARRDVTNASVVQGEKLFNQLNCSGCHTPTVYTGVDIRLPALSNQRIHPYTDLLLHDLGADLADGRPDFLADGNEWRTPALWGIGLFEKTNGVPFYLHDGRARSLLEAVMWHAGEARKSKDAFVKLSKTDRDAVIAFLRSL